MKRLNLSLDDRLFGLIAKEAENKGIPPTTLVVGNLEDLYLRDKVNDFETIFSKICDEAQKMPKGEPFILAQLPSFTELIISTAEKAHISPSPVRARIGKSFNAAVRNHKVGDVERAMKNGKPLNNAGVAMYVRPKIKKGHENRNNRKI